MNTINEFFNGNLYPFEMLTCSKESIAAEKTLNEYLKTVDENCPREDKVFLSDKIREQISVLETLLAEQAFELGFSLGVKLTADCYKKS